MAVTVPGRIATQYSFLNGIDTKKLLQPLAKQKSFLRKNGEMV